MSNVLGPNGFPATALFTVDVAADGDDRCRLRARGELDAAAVGILSDALHDPARPRRRFVTLDMAGVTFCDASGLTALLSAHEECAARGGRLVLCDVPPRVQSIMRIVGLDAVLCGALLPGEATQDRRAVAGTARFRRRRKVPVVDGVTTTLGGP
jgi:anti-anti-sigma factor